VSRQSRLLARSSTGPKLTAGITACVSTLIPTRAKLILLRPPGIGGSLARIKIRGVARIGANELARLHEALRSVERPNALL
jgi:hypothetical protein